MSSNILNQKILNYLKENPNKTAKDISEALNEKIMIVYGALEELSEKFKVAADNIPNGVGWCVL